LRSKVKVIRPCKAQGKYAIIDEQAFAPSLDLVVMAAKDHLLMNFIVRRRPHNAEL